MPMEYKQNGFQDHRNREERFRNLVENIGVGIVALDRSWRITYLNPMAEDLLDQPGDQLMGREIWKVLGGTVNSKFYHACREAMYDDSVTYVEDFVPDTEKWMRTVIYPSSSGLSIYFHDITENRMAASKVQATENQFRELVDRITDGFIALDKNFNYIYANKVFGDLVHRDPEDLVGKNVWKEFPEAVGTPTYYAFHKALKEQVYVGNVDYFAPLDLWYENRIYPSADGLSVFIEDITDKKKAEEALQHSNERFYYATKAASDVLWELNFETRTAVVHEGKEKFLDVDEQPEWQMGVDATYVAPEDRERVKDSFRKARFDRSVQRWQDEYRVLNRKGEVIYVVNNAIFIRNEKGQAVRVIGAMTDVTERKKLERRLRSQVRKKQLEIIEATLQAQERERTEIGRELHDNVNQIVTATRLMLTIARDDPSGAGDLISKCIEHLTQVIDENRKIAHELVTPDLEKESLLEQFYYLAQSMLVSNGIEAEVFASGFDEELLTDAQRLTLYRIVQEQCTNIVKHAGASSVKIHVATSTNSVHMVIHDDGRGMNADEVKKGIGLKNIEGRLRVFDGKLEVETEEGGGFGLMVSMPVGG